MLTGDLSTTPIAKVLCAAKQTLARSDLSAHGASYESFRSVYLRISALCEGYILCFGYFFTQMSLS